MTGVKLIFATHNDYKFKEFKEILKVQLSLNEEQLSHISSSKALSISDVVENGITFEKNAVIKAKHTWQKSKIPSVADDSGIIVDVFGNAPGVFSARWNGKHNYGSDNATLLLEQLQDVPKGNRGARFVCAMALVNGESVQTVVGEVKGTLTFEMRGTHGFGYDPIFIPHEQPKETIRTFAEFTSDEKNKISHRSRAINQISAKIKKLVL
jgi:XTP/dITP diphosphohydrolase